MKDPLTKISLLTLVLGFFLFAGYGLAQDSSFNSFPDISGGEFYNVEPLVQRFTDLANRKTGLTMSFLGGQSSITQTGASTYDMSLWAMGTPYGRRVISTYAQNSTVAKDEENLQTSSKGYSPEGGVLSFIRMTGIDQYGWWGLWEWSVKGGENAWIGMAALREYVQFQDPWAIAFAKQRADFILSLQDSDGGLRMGPRGQYFAFRLKDGWWAIKSTENNESALYFLDQIYLITKDGRYKKAADKIYHWLMTKMFDTSQGIFHRGMSYSSGAWRLDSLDLFSPDTVTCAPVERMLKDPRFGTTPAERIHSITRMMEQAEKRIGVYSNSRLLGLSFSSDTKFQGIVSPEWTAQYIILCDFVSKLYKRFGDNDESQQITEKGSSLLEMLSSWYAQNNNALPYALYYQNGLAAQSVPTGHGWDTPDSDAALASTMYYGFATQHFDPLRDLIPHQY